MKTVKIEAYNGQGKNRTFAGEREVEQPETVAEAVKLYESEDNLLELAWRSYRIDVQREIRGKSPIAEAVQQIVRKIKAGDKDLLAKMTELGLKPSDLGLGNGEDEGREEDEANQPAETPAKGRGSRR